VDTPGLHRPKHELGRRINHAALESLRSADAILYVTDVPGRDTGAATRAGTKSAKARATSVHPDDERLIKLLPEDVPVVLAINKIDRLRDKTRLLPLMVAYQELFGFAAFVPISARKADGLEPILAELIQVLPEGESTYDEDTLTDRPMQFFAREYVREQVMMHCRREVPHAVAVTIDSFKQSERRAEILATIHVEKEGQRGVIIGKGGAQLKQIGTEARARLEQLMDTPVYLELFVRVTERWKNVPRQLAELGYEASGGRSLSSVLGAPAKPKRRPENKRRRNQGAA
jgi:GTP-binding protein Era